MKRSVLLGSFGVALVLGGGAYAAAAAVSAQSPSAVVAERRAGLKAAGEAQKALDGILKSDDAVDWAKVRASAKTINDNVSKIPGWFPAGTAMGTTGLDTKARPEIWTDNAKFMEIAKKVGTETAKLQAASAGTNKAAVQDAFGALSCRECHMSFRAR